MNENPSFVRSRKYFVRLRVCGAANPDFGSSSKSLIKFKGSRAEALIRNSGSEEQFNFGSGSATLGIIFWRVREKGTLFTAPALIFTKI